MFAMDNTGQTRSVQATRGRAPTFTRIDSKILELLRLDMDAAGEALRSGSGAGAKYAVVGYGIGANVAIMYAGDNPEVGALALVLPGHDCEQYEASDLIAVYGPRPLLLIESKSRTPSDLSQTIRLYIASGKDSSKERFALPREPVPSGEEQGYGMDELCDWLQRRLPAAKP